MAKLILVIDDEESVRDAFQLALEDLDYRIELASSGEQGVAQAKAEKPDLVFLDLKMPGMDGVQTARQLLALYPELQVYIVTAFAQEFMEPLSAASASGLVFQVAQKPLGMSEIQIIVQGALDQPQAY